MIRPVSSISFNGAKNLGAQKVARKVVNVAKQAPSGISKTPVRLLDAKEEQYIKTAIGVCVGTSAASCAIEFLNGCTIGSQMV